MDSLERLMGSVLPNGQHGALAAASRSRNSFVQASLCSVIGRKGRHLNGTFSLSGDTMEGIIQCLVFLKAFSVALSFNGMVGGVTLGLFSLGMFIPWANAKGAMTGAVVSLALVMWIGLGAQVATLRGEIHEASMPTSVDKCPCLNATLTAQAMLEPESHEEAWSIYRISYLWYSAIGCLTTMLVGVIVSYFTGFQDPRDLDYDLVSPPVRKLLGTTKSKPHPGHVLGITNLALDMDDEKPRIDANGVIQEKAKL